MRNDSGRKRILYLMEYPIDLPGGGQESTKTLCEGVRAAGDFETFVACPMLLSSSVSDYPYTVITYPSDENRELSKVRRITNFLGRIRWFYKIIRQIRPDLIHVSMSESLITFGALRVAGFFSDIPFVYTDRGLCFGYRRHSMACIKATMKHARYMITTTKYNADLWKKVIRTPIRVIPNTISRAFADYDPEGRKRAKVQYNTGDIPVIGFAGRISEEKDWGKVPSVVAAIAKEGISFKVALVLSVYEDRDEQIAATVRDGITDVIGKENLIYMQDLSQKEISQYYYLVDFFIMTSNFESFGKAAVEAMSRRCIVLSTPVGGLREVIGNKDDLYETDRPQKLAKRIKYLLEHPDEADAERQMFYRRFADNYTSDKNIEGHVKLYKEILG